MSLPPIPAAGGAIPAASVGLAGASGPAPTPAAGPVAAPPAVQAFVAEATDAALSAMMSEAATTQDSAAPLLANLAAAAQAPQTPDPARAVATQILSTQTPLQPDVTPAALKAAVQSSGVFLEAAVAAAVQTPGGASPDLQTDLKALLLQLSAALAQAETPEAATAPPQPAAQAQAQNPTQAAAQPQAQPQAQAQAAATPQRSPAAPPLAGGALSGQAATPPTLDPGASRQVIVSALKQQADAALARVQLSQAASVPKPDEPTRWVFDLPVATPGGTAMGQFEISRDGRGPRVGAGAPDPTWRARFSMDLSPSGPVHVDLAMTTSQSRVTLMAENEAARQTLAARQADLTAALAADGGGDVAVRVVRGAPARPNLAPGRLLDARS